MAGVLRVSEIYEDPGLLERDYGKASGLTAEERAARFPDGRYDGIEDWASLRDRVLSALIRSAGKFPSEDIIAVSHGSAINSVLAELSNHEIGTGKTRLKNACVNMLEYRDDLLSIVFCNKSADELVQPTSLEIADRRSGMEAMSDRYNADMP